jgi:hypothetical protein
MWEAMHGAMRGFYEARTRGPDRRLYRLFCVLEREAPGIDRPSIVVIAGFSKPHGSAFTDADYARVRRLGEEYRRRPAERRVVGGYAGSNGAIALTAVGPRRAARPGRAPRRRRARAAPLG